MKNAHLTKKSNSGPERRFFKTIRIPVIGLWLILSSTLPAIAKEIVPGSKDNAKELSGMSIVGNDEAPKSLYIVPWKSSEVGLETTLAMMLNDNAVPVDKDVFMRQLSFYEVCTADPTSLKLAGKEKNE